MQNDNEVLYQWVEGLVNDYAPLVPGMAGGSFHREATRMFLPALREALNLTSPPNEEEENADSKDSAEDASE